MKNYFLLKFIKKSLKEYIFIFLTSIILLLFISFTKSFSEENVFTINDVKVKGGIDVNFSREKYLNRAFYNSFNILMNKILLTSDLQKISNIKLKEVKKQKDLHDSHLKINNARERTEYDGLTLQEIKKLNKLPILKIAI
mgnify:CR=1 FL=1